MAKNKQSEMPLSGKGVAREKIAAIETAAEEYEDLRDKRMTLGEEEVKARTKLASLMQKHGLNQYRFDGKMVTIDPSEAKVKVKKVKDEDDE